jgi:hypothetical protein
VEARSVRSRGRCLDRAVVAVSGEGQQQSDAVQRARRVIDKPIALLLDFGFTALATMPDAAKFGLLNVLANSVTPAITKAERRGDSMKTKQRTDQAIADGAPDFCCKCGREADLCVCGKTNETKHTPGPWKATEKNGLADCIMCNPDERDTGTYIALMESSRGQDETSANARLIAAAPDLLAALKRAMTFLDNWEFNMPAAITGDNQPVSVVSIRDQARAAISKAENNS